MIRLLLALALLAMVGCGGDGEDTEIIVGAAASLTVPITEIARAYEREHPDVKVRVEFAGSETLAARVRQGARLDVLVSADPRVIDGLRAEGLAGTPQPVAGNELVVLARADSSVRTLGDISRAGVRLAIGTESVPVGAYAREALLRLSPEIAEGALDNVRSQELDARGLTAKLDQEIVDAVVAYRTDALPLRLPPRVIRFPDGIAPEVRYAASTTSSRAAGAALQAWLTGPTARQTFAAAGFGS